ncbi:hypothetical protein CCICO_04265 [Corynebacterium ciconiae DSM 44920]|nr:hypothetical protein [Corynebacterium ciconiae]WKD60890.1 hypothetical protein CCICO_04265 [Corynebacterium ciconiae DSM 44920]
MYRRYLHEPEWVEPRDVYWDEEDEERKRRAYDLYVESRVEAAKE